MVIFAVTATAQFHVFARGRGLSAEYHALCCVGGRGLVSLTIGLPAIRSVAVCEVSKLLLLLHYCLVCDQVSIHTLSVSVSRG